RPSRWSPPPTAAHRSGPVLDYWPPVRASPPESGKDRKDPHPLPCRLRPPARKGWPEPQSSSLSSGLSRHVRLGIRYVVGGLQPGRYGAHGLQPLFRRCAILMHQYQLVGIGHPIEPEVCELRPAGLERFELLTGRGLVAPESVDDVLHLAVVLELDDDLHVQLPRPGGGRLVEGNAGDPSGLDLLARRFRRRRVVGGG